MILKLIKLLPRFSEAISSLQVKGWYLSKTIWSNLFVLVGSVAYAVTGNDALSLSTDEAAALSLAAVAVGNIILRILTSKPVGVRSIPGAAGSGSETSEQDTGNLGI